METIKILLVEDHLLVRNGLKILLETDNSFEIVGEASNGEEGLKLAIELLPDLVITDIRMPIMNGIDLVKAITQENLPCKCMILSMHDAQDYILQALSAGASGYLLKDSNKDELIKAIKSIHKGEKYFTGATTNALLNQFSHRETEPTTENLEHKLTKKETEILTLVLSGLTNLEIANKLKKSKRTIETHRFNLMKKLNVKNLVELSKKASELGLN